MLHLTPQKKTSRAYHLVFIFFHQSGNDGKWRLPEVQPVFLSDATPKSTWAPKRFFSGTYHLFKYLHIFMLNTKK